MDKEIKTYYIKYKAQILPIIFLFLIVFLIFRVIIPQFSTISEIKTNIESKSKEVEILQSSLNTLNTQDDNVILQNSKIVNTALPSVKDLSAVFLALTSASSLSNVDVKGFSLKVGGVYGKSASTYTPSVLGVPFLTVSVQTFSNDPKNMIFFVRELQKKMPLSEVKTVNAQSGSGGLEINFYYKPYDISSFAKEDKIVPLSTSEEKILELLKSWE